MFAPILLLIFVYFLVFLIFSVMPFFINRGNTPVSRLGIGLSALPVLITALSFYSACVHMYIELADWPKSLGYDGFSSRLETHLYTAQFLFSALLLGTLFLYPLACAAYFANPRLLLPYLSTFSKLSLIFYLSFFLMPSGFMRWWID